MFIDKTDLVVLKIFYRKSGRNFIAYTEDSFKKAKLSDEKKEKYKTVEIKMKPLTWDLYNELQDSSWVNDPETNQRKFNYRQYKENRLKKLIVEWDAKKPNAKGELEPIPVSEENIMSLSPDIAESILEAYDIVSTLTDDEEKK